MYSIIIKIDDEMKLKHTTTQRTIRNEARYIDKLVDEMIARIVTTPKALQDCQANALAVLKKRKILTARGESRPRIINSRNEGSTFKSHGKAKTQRDKIESEVITKQFIMNNRELIKTKLVSLLLRM